VVQGLDGLTVEVSQSHTIRHARTHALTPARTHLQEWSARRRGRYLHHTQKSQETNTHSSRGIRTRDPSNQQAAVLRLWQHGHWDWPFFLVSEEFKSILLRWLDATVNTLPDLKQYLHTTLNLPYKNCNHFLHIVSDMQMTTSQFCEVGYSISSAKDETCTLLTWLDRNRLVCSSEVNNGRFKIQRHESCCLSTLQDDI
jgi:hypothetical protein